MDKKGILTKEMLKSFKKSFIEDPYNKVMMDAVSNVSITEFAINRESLVNMDFTFSNEIKTGEITAQMKSGRCWIFAGTNTLRTYLMKKLNVENIELSQNYPFFFDKIEKSNYFLENIIETIDKDIRDRTVMWLLQAPIGDGGQWDMFINLVEKYGVVPKKAFPETYNSSNSSTFNKLLTLKLREFASILRKMRKQGKQIEEIRKEKEKMMETVFKIVSINLGLPPEKFDFEYRDKKGKFHRIKGLTPQQFYKDFIGLNLRNYVSLINAPMYDKEYNKTYTVKYLGNVKGGKDVLYLNLPVEEIKQYTIKQLKNKEPVWFGCDVGQFSERKKGIMDSELFNFNYIFKTDFKWDKGERLDYGESRLTHAMVFTGVNLVNNKPNRWKVENSWGKEAGNKGFFIMSDKWFNEFLYQVVINKKYLPEKVKKLLKQKPVELPPWDPMGSLAIMK